MSLGVFIVIGLSTIILGFFRLNKAIVLPFKRSTQVTFKTADQLEKERTQKLRTQDTDGDGLTDYDELYVFRTSPFLEDSDSDGTNDGAEVAAETDPNCPKGRTCRQAKIFASGQTGNTGSPTSTGGTPAPTDTNAPAGNPTDAEAKVMAVIEETFGPIETLTPKKIKEGLETMSATDLRTFLGKLGVPGQALQKADDATLRKLVEETLSEIAVPEVNTNEPATNANANTNAP